MAFMASAVDDVYGDDTAGRDGEPEAPEVTGGPRADVAAPQALVAEKARAATGLV